MDIKTANGEWLTVKTLYVPNASGTIILPTFIAMDNCNFTSWHQMSHTDTGTAKIIFSIDKSIDQRYQSQCI